MTEETFDKIVKLIQDTRKREEAFSKALAEYNAMDFHGFFTPVTIELISILEDALNDKDDLIRWTIEEQDFGNEGNVDISMDGKVIVTLDTPQKLYNYLKENYHD